MLVEGTCGAGKTTLARALVARDATIALADQRETYGPIALREDAGTLDDAFNRAHLLGVATRLRRHVVDTLHLTQRVRPGVLSAASFEEVDALLDGILVIVQVSPAALWDRVVVGRRGTPFRRYAAKFGASDAALHDWLCDEQEQIAALASRSRLPVLVVDGEAPAQGTTERVLARLLQT